MIGQYCVGSDVLLDLGKRTVLPQTIDGGYLSSNLDIKKGVGEQLHYCIIFKKNPQMKL